MICSSDLFVSRAAILEAEQREPSGACMRANNSCCRPILFVYTWLYFGEGPHGCSFGGRPHGFFPEKLPCRPRAKALGSVRPWSVVRGRAYGSAGTGAAGPPARLVSFTDGEGGGAKGRESDG